MKQLFALLFAVALTPVLSHAASFDYFLKVDGIEGESTDKGHSGEIEVSSFSWGVSNSGAASHRGGSGAGKATIRDLTISKSVDKSSPMLMVSCANGKHFKTAVLTVRRNSDEGRGSDYLVIKMEDVIVTSYQTGGSGDDIVDAVSFNFGTISMKTADGTTEEIGVSGKRAE